MTKKKVFLEEVCDNFYHLLNFLFVSQKNYVIPSELKVEIIVH